MISICIPLYTPEPNNSQPFAVCLWYTKLRIYSLDVPFCLNSLSYLINVHTLPLSNLPTVVIDAFPSLEVEQGTSVVLVCRVVGVLSSDTVSFSWTCPGSSCSTGTVRQRDSVLLVDVIDSATHAGTYNCTVNVTGSDTSQSVELMVNSKLYSVRSVFAEPC